MLYKLSWPLLKNMYLLKNVCGRYYGIEVMYMYQLLGPSQACKYMLKNFEISLK